MTENTTTPNAVAGGVYENSTAWQSYHLCRPLRAFAPWQSSFYATAFANSRGTLRTVKRFGSSSNVAARGTKQPSTHYIGYFRPLMKSVIAPALATILFSTVLVCVVFAASELTPRYETHKFESLDASIWTSKPTRVDQTAQTFERLPPKIKIADSEAQRFEFRDPMATQSGISSQPTKAHGDSFETSAKSGWRHSRYRSYRDEDNSYQPFSGGPRAQCKGASRKGGNE
ncbi:hypothetical protein [Rhizobium sp. RAF56]|uniref:hypothetical protein n=1 Tax=Rhizobium sp. RAF56 TaxID=3233062 RepID=UPI003F9A5E4D